MHPDKNKIAADCWKKGTEALSKQNWDYAIEMFFQAAMFVPDNLNYRQTLRGAERKKYGDNGSGARMAGMRLMKVRGQAKKARMTHDWDRLDRVAEEGLQVNPWDGQLNADVAEACSQRGFDECAIFGFQKAIEADPDNKPWNKKLAALHESRGNYEEAINRWRHIYKLDPKDSEARTKISGLEASSAMERGGWEDAKSTQDIKKTAYDEHRTGRSAVPEEALGPGMSQEADLQRAIRKDPASKDGYLKLADFYRRNKQLEEAREALQKALEISGDVNVREQMEDVELDLFRRNLERAKDAHQADAADETAKKNHAALARELVHREIEVFSRRVERYPQDMKLKFELARRFMRRQEWKQAIPLLQQAANDTRLQAEGRLQLARCFIGDKKATLAHRQLSLAAELLNPQDNKSAFCETHYLLGRLEEEANHRDAAEKHYNEIIAYDYGYKDAIERLERLQGEAGEAE